MSRMIRGPEVRLDRKPERRLGWEVARDLEREKTTIWARVVPEWRQVRAALGALIIFFVIFLLACWLAATRCASKTRG